MEKILFAIFILWASPAVADVIYTESWDSGTTVNKGNYSSVLSYNTSAPDYCVNPDPPDDCATSNLGCDQTIGPIVAVSSIPESTCKHSINIDDGGADGWPSPVDGDNIIRFYIDDEDSMVKGHLGGRTELFCNENCDMSATENDRWYGYAIYFPALASSNFTYDGHVFQQFKNKYVGTGSDVPLLFWINGGTEHAWRDEIHFRVYHSNYENTDVALVPTAAVTAAGRMSGNSPNQGVIIKNTSPNGSGSINDLGDWMYLVFVYHHDWRSTTTDGRFTMWYASQAMIDSGGTGMSSYLKIYDETNFATGRTSDQQDTNIFRIGADQPGGTSVVANRNSYQYPMINYRDNFKVGDGTESTDALNFAEVNPAVQSSSSPGAVLRGVSVRGVSF